MLFIFFMALCVFFGKIKCLRLVLYSVSNEIVVDLFKVPEYPAAINSSIIFSVQQISSRCAWHLSTTNLSYTRGGLFCLYV